MLINLLIAIFSNTYADTEAKSGMVIVVILWYLYTYNIFNPGDEVYICAVPPAESERVR